MILKLAIMVEDLTASSDAEVLFHAIENTANQNTGKPLCIRRY